MKERPVWRMPDPTWRNTPANIVLGIKGGVTIAILCTAMATIVLVLTLSDPFEVYHTTFVKGIAAYFAGGIVAGAIGGVLRPLTRWAHGEVLRWRAHGRHGRYGPPHRPGRLALLGTL